MADDWTENINNNARTNNEAHYKDGKYQVLISANDVDYNNNPKNTVSETADILLDNHIPYIEKVTVTVYNSMIYYAWREWDANNAQLVLHPSLQNGTVNSGFFDLEILITASEPLKDIFFENSVLGYFTMTSLNTDKTKWKVTIPAMIVNDVFTTGSTGSQTLSFTGSDLADNQLLAFAPSLLAVIG